MCRSFGAAFLKFRRSCRRTVSSRFFAVEFVRRLTSDSSLANILNLCRQPTDCISNESVTIDVGYIGPQPLVGLIASEQPHLQVIVGQCFRAYSVFGFRDYVEGDRLNVLPQKLAH